MKKLKLHPDELRVESFATVANGNGRGTVQANDSNDWGDPLSTQCWTDPTADTPWQTGHTCPECAPMATPDGPCTDIC
jgi:hypothetical protein